MSAQLALPDLVRTSLALTADGAATPVAPAFAGDSLNAVPAPRDPVFSNAHRRARLRHSWDGEPTASFGCRFETVGEMLPTFARTSFNPYLDGIIRNPDQFIAEAVPVGTVSKTYTLVQHGQAVDAIARALDHRGISPSELPTEVVTTEFGNRFTCSVRLPEKYDFVEIDGTRMALTIECFNSVDASASFRLLAGWFRFICSNGLIVGTRTLDYRRAHTPSLELSDVEAALDRALAAADLERTRFERWQRVELPWPRVVRWVEKELSEQWGSVAAARVLHIARTGNDAAPLTRQWRGPSDRRPMAATMAVPGSAPPNNTLYRLSQILSWMAGQTGELSARTERRAQVSALTRRLAHACIV
ncbi:MAG: DUF932 domain-containing protein [Bacteroidales bacterium]